MSTAKEEKTNTATGKKLPRKMRATTKMFLIFMCLVTMAFLRTGFVFIVVSLLPSIIAYFMDRSSHRYIFKCVFCWNFSALMPSIIKLAMAGPSNFLIGEMMRDPLNWILIYGAALMGLMLVNIMSSLSQVMVNGLHKNHVVNLNNNQKKIEQEWGHEVTQFSHPDHPEV